jgi:DNA gyrase subunit A
VSLKEETEKRYLNYALSVITSRALPDVRDGLKPVQRRILYSMYYDLKLLPNARFKKSATVVGDVMGKYHPHGDQAIYDTMVRMAQHFSLLHPLVDGYGNFGSIDGDKQAAMRYTEARLQPLSLEMLDEIKHETVEHRPNFDGSLEEPVVLPSRFPQLLINGSAGIAVGMATNIPPHNLQEVMDALLLLVDVPEATTADILKRVKGPDFPTGGELIASRKERLALYEKGQGNVMIRGEYKEEKVREKGKKNKRVIITSTPYNVTRSVIVEKIAEVIVERKLPPLLDVRDESTEQTRIVLDVKSGADVDLVMAYLYKHTPLQQRFSVNMTCLVPTPNPQVAAPERLSLKQMLEQFLAFRFEVLERRFRCELRRIMDRIHILEGFRIVFNALDEAIKLIRESDGRKDAGIRLQKRFGLSDRQTEAILDTRLYRLAKLEIKVILEELAKLQARADEIEAILNSRELMNDVFRGECKELVDKYGVPRRTRIRESDKAPELQSDAFVEEEDTHVILTRDGWVKRIRTISDISSIRVRENDEILAILPGSTKESVGFVTNMGVVYTSSIWDIKATTGYGVALQTMFKFKDGERVVAGVTLDPRYCGDIGLPKEGEEPSDEMPSTQLLVVTEKGFGSRVSLAPFVEPSNRSGRRYTRLTKGDQVIEAFVVSGSETLVLASEKRRYLAFGVGEVKFLSGPGKGVGLIKLDDDLVFAAAVSREPTQGLVLETVDDEIVEITPQTGKGTGKRLSKGTQKRGVKGWKRKIPEELIVPTEVSEQQARPETPDEVEDELLPEPTLPGLLTFDF